MIYLSILKLGKTYLCKKISIKDTIQMSAQTGGMI